MSPPSFRRPGLLDRLIDDFPEEQNPRDPDVAADEARRHTWEAWRESLRRDLAMLLSARFSARAANPAHPRAADSVAHYGVVFASSGRSRTVAPDSILRAISVFEPRFREPGLLAGDAEPSVICSLSGWVEWDGGGKSLVVKVFSEGDDWKVELYE